MRYLFLLAFFFNCFAIQAQTPVDDVAETPRWVVGIESTFHFQDIDYNVSNYRYYGLGINIEKPIGKFSVGTGLIQQRFGKQAFRTPSGQYRPGEDGGQETFGYDKINYQLSFLQIPLRLQYRLPCNCAYVQAGLQTSIRQLDTKPESTDHQFLIDQPGSNVYDLQDIKPLSLGYELAFGMNIHISRSFKMFGRLSYYQYGFSNDQDIKYKKLGNSFLSMNMGVQYAIY